MPASISHLLSIKSRQVEGVVRYCSDELERLDQTGFFFRHHNGGSRPIRISDVLIDGRVFTVEKQRGQTDSHDGRSKDEDAIGPHEKLLAELYETPSVGGYREAEPWSLAIRKAKVGRPLVVLGAPGGGKTTLSRSSVVSRLTDTHRALQDSRCLAHECAPAIWITCTALAQAWMTVVGRRSVSLLNTLITEACSISADTNSDNAHVTQQWLSQCLSSGRGLIVLDSLDEVPTELEIGFKHAARYLPHLPSPAILTCRVVEWQTRQSWLGWLGWQYAGPYDLAPLDAREVRRYIMHFFGRGISRPELREGMMQALANHSVRKMCDSPILLFFCCLLHAKGGLNPLPPLRRAELYREILSSLLKGEWKENRLAPPWADGFHCEYAVTEWLAAIAYHLFLSSPASKTFSQRSWREAVESPDAQALQRGLIMQISSGELLNQLLDIGLLIKAGRNEGTPMFSFAHRSLLSYLGGRALSRLPTDAWMKTSIEHLWLQPEWEDVILFLAGELDGSQVNLLLAEIESKPEDIFEQRLCWQWRIAGEAAVVANKWADQWSSDLMQWLNNSDQAQFSIGNAVHNSKCRAFQSAASNMPTLASYFVSLLSREWRHMKESQQANWFDIVECLPSAAVECFVTNSRVLSSDPSIAMRVLANRGDEYSIGRLVQIAAKGYEEIPPHQHPLEWMQRYHEQIEAIWLLQEGEYSVAAQAMLDLFVESGQSGVHWQLRQIAAETLGEMCWAGTLPELVSVQQLAVALEATILAISARWIRKWPGDDDGEGTYDDDLLEGVSQALNKIHFRYPLVAVGRSFFTAEALAGLTPLRRHVAAFAIGAVGREDAEALLLDAFDPFDNSDPVFIQVTVDALGKVGGSRSVKLLVALLLQRQNGEVNLVWEQTSEGMSCILSALGSLGDASAADSMRRELANPVFARSAIYAVGDMKLSCAIPQLTSMLHNGDNGKAVIYALASIGSEEATTVFSEYLKIGKDDWTEELLSSAHNHCLYLPNSQLVDLLCTAKEGMTFDYAAALLTKGAWESDWESIVHNLCLFNPQNQWGAIREIAHGVMWREGVRNDFLIQSIGTERLRRWEACHDAVTKFHADRIKRQQVVRFTEVKRLRTRSKAQLGTKRDIGSMISKEVSVRNPAQDHGSGRPWRNREGH